VQHERKYANYMLLMHVCFLLALYQHLANTTATEAANTKLHKLLKRLNVLLSVMAVMPLPYFFQAVLLSFCQCPVH